MGRIRYGLGHLVVLANSHTLAYLLAQNRQLTQPGFSNFSQTPEDIEGDLRFVNTV